MLAYDVAAGLFKAVVDDPSRFKSSTDAVAAHFGLTRRRFQSAELETPGQTPPEGLVPMFAQLGAFDEPFHWRDSHSIPLGALALNSGRAAIPGSCARPAP